MLTPLIAELPYKVARVSTALRLPEYLTWVALEETLHRCAKDGSALDDRGYPGSNATRNWVIELHATLFPAHEELLSLVKT